MEKIKSSLSEITSFKMVGGLEVVAEVTAIHYIDKVVDGLAEKVIKSWTVRKPHILQVVQAATGMNMVLIPWTLSNPEIDSLTIPREAVLVWFEPSAMCANQYISETSSLDLSATQAALNSGRISK
jgi:hypothetical protein